jgi:hypothetical protein
MPTLAIQSDLEAIVAHNQAKLAERQAEEAAPVQGNKTEASESSAASGVKPELLMRPPAPAPNMLNQEMAEAAAKKFKKKEKRIQRACAALDAGEPLPPQQSACCVIL